MKARSLWFVKILGLQQDGQAVGSLFIIAPTVSKAITAAKQVAREMGHARPEIDSVRLKGTIDAEVAK